MQHASLRHAPSNLIAGQWKPLAGAGLKSYNPARPAELAVLARRCGFAEVAEFSRTLERHRSAVHGIFRDLFYSAEEEQQDEISKEVRVMLDPAGHPFCLCWVLR